MSKKKLTTAEILAKARADAANKDAADAGDSGAADAASADTPAPKAPSGQPKSTKDILAAARAQAAGGEQAGADSGSEASAQADAPAASKAAAPAGAGRPKSTKDILAAARSQAKGGGSDAEAPAAAKPAAPKPVVSKKGATAASAAGGGTKPSVQDMLKAVREGKKIEPAAAESPVQGAVAAAPAKLKLPPTPVKPASAPKPGRKSAGAESRRDFLFAMVLAPFALAWWMCAAISGLGVLLTARFMFPNVLVEPPSIFKIGSPSDYPPGSVATKWKQQFGVWIVHTEFAGRDVIYALRSVCTHLGCTPNWLEGEQKFKCPCHGSGFRITGINFEGPAPRPLERVGLKLAEDGMLQVDKSMKFQQELGQWEDSASFVEVV